MLAVLQFPLGHPRPWRMHSTLRQRKKLRELEVQFDVKNTATLVAACNKSKDNQEQHDAFLDWMENYVRFFEQLSISDSHQQAMEFVQLADVVAEDARTKELVRNAFCCLCSKIRDNNYGEEKLILALCYFLLSVDCQAFQGNPHHLTRLARDVIAKLGLEATFSRGTYPTHSVSLFALHHLCAVIHEVDPVELDHGRQDGLYQLLDQCLQNIINTQSYYPFCYQAMLTRQSLASMDSNRGTSSKEIWYRLFHAMRGVAYFYQALAEVATAKVDVSCIEKGVEELTEAFARHNIESQDWFEIVQELINFRILVQKDPEELENFHNCLQKVDQILDHTKNKEDQLILRHTMIRQVTLLAFESPSKMVREWAVEEFFNIGTCHAQRKGWGKDVETLEALLDALFEIHQKGEFGYRMKGVIDRMKFYFRTEEQSETICNWMRITRWRDDVEGKSKPENIIDGNVLFQKVRAELLIDESISTQDEVQNELKKKYKRESKVPSLFDNETPRHVQTLQHSLMLHIKKRKNNGEEELEMTSIELNDLFNDRKTVFEEKVERVKQVFLFGNPGTGKTTIAKKIAYMWSIGEWGVQFDLVYLVPVRELVSIKYDDLSMRTRRNLQTCITNICFPGKNDDVYKSIRQQVEDDLDRDSTLIVLDGFDEGEEMTKKLITTIESKPCRVLVLSRPRNLQSLKDSTNVEVECVGMNDKQLIEFIELETSLNGLESSSKELETSSHDLETLSNESYTSSSESYTSSNELVEHLQRRPAIWEISHVTVVANILTSLYNTKKESIVSEESNLDMFSLYWKMSLKLWERYVDRNESNVDRNQIFEALEEIAFCALENGYILIEHDMVQEISGNRQMRDVLRDCGFLLLKKEGLFYQFPHLTFQEFFAGQYMAHCLMSKDDELNQKAIDFLVEHKYCANFRQMLCFMSQACVVRKGDRGYQEMELLIDATPIALGYQQHLALKLELLEAALSTSKQQSRARILNSTKVLKIALGWIRRIIWGNRKFSYNPFVPFRNANILASIVDYEAVNTSNMSDLFAKVAKVARYNPSHWEEVTKMLSLRTASGDDSVVRQCRWSVRRTIPEEEENIEMLLWEDYDSDEKCTKKEEMKYQSNVRKFIPIAPDIMHKASKSSSIDESIDTKTVLDAIEEEELPDRLHEIVKLMETRPSSIDEGLEDQLVFSIKQLATRVRERRDDLVQFIEEWPNDDDDTKLKLVEQCKAIAEKRHRYTQEFVEILWTRCQCDSESIPNSSRYTLVDCLKGSRILRDTIVGTLSMLSKSEPQRNRSSLVQFGAVGRNSTQGKHDNINRLFLSLDRQLTKQLYRTIVESISETGGNATEEKEMELHLLHLLCLKALEPPEVEENELTKAIDEADAYPNKVVVLSTILTSIPMCLQREWAPWTLRKLASRYPKYKQMIFDTLEKLTKDGNTDLAKDACFIMIPVLGKEPQRAERILSRFEVLIHLKGCAWFGIDTHQFASLDELFEAYIAYHSEVLIPFIVRNLFMTPAIMKTMSDGSTQLIVQKTSDSKTTHHLKTAEDSEVFMSIVNKCTERRFQEVASSILY